MAGFSPLAIYSESEAALDPLIFHFRASDLEELPPGAPVTEWPNHGSLGGALRVYAAQDYQPPIFRPNAQPFNGQPAVRFNRNSDQSTVLAFGDFDIPDPSAGFTVFAVYTVSHRGPRGLGYIGRANRPTSGNGFALEAGSGSPGPGYRFGSGHNLAVEDDRVSLRDAVFSTWRIGQFSSIADSEFRFRGVELEMDPENPDAIIVFQNSGQNEFMLGGRLNTRGNRAVDNQEYQGFIAEILVFNHQLNDAEVEVIENVLAQKYGIRPLR